MAKYVVAGSESGLASGSADQTRVNRGHPLTGPPTLPTSRVLYTRDWRPETGPAHVVIISNVRLISSPKYYVMRTGDHRIESEKSEKGVASVLRGTNSIAFLVHTRPSIAAQGIKEWRV